MAFREILTGGKQF